MSVNEITVWVIFSFVFSVVLISMYYATDTSITALDTAFSDPTVTAWFSEMMGVWTWLDYALTFSLLSFISGSIVLGYFIRTHPVFYVPYMIGGFFVAFLSWIFREVWLEIVNANAGFLSASASFPTTAFIMDNLPFLVIVSCVVIATVQYSKSDAHSYLFKHY